MRALDAGFLQTNLARRCHKALRLELSSTLHKTFAMLCVLPYQAAASRALTPKRHNSRLKTLTSICLSHLKQINIALAVTDSLKNQPSICLNPLEKYKNIASSVRFLLHQQGKILLNKWKQHGNNSIFQQTEVELQHASSSRTGWPKTRASPCLQHWNV